MDTGTTGDETRGTNGQAVAPDPFLPPQPGAPRLSTLAPPTGAPVQPVATQATQAAQTAQAAPPAPAPIAPAAAPAEVPVLGAATPFLPAKRALPPLAPIVSRPDRAAEPAPVAETAAAEPPAPAPTAAPAAPVVPTQPPSVLLPPVPTTVFRSDEELAELVAQATAPAPAPEEDTAPEAAAVAAPPVFAPLTPLTPLTPTTPESQPAPAPLLASTGVATSGATNDSTAHQATAKPAKERKAKPAKGKAKPATSKPAKAKVEKATKRRPIGASERSPRSTLTTVFAMVVLIGLVAAGVVIARRAMSSDQGASSWPADVAPLVQYVETARDATFDHPVRVQRHSNDEYATVLAAEHYRATLPSNADLYASFLHALGLLPDAGVDAAQMHLAITHAEAFYSWRTQTIHVRGDGATASPAADAAMIEALVDALYDQRFQLAERTPSTTDIVIAGADGARLAADYAGTDFTEAVLRDSVDWSIEGPLDQADVPWTIRDLVAAQVLLPSRLLLHTVNHPGVSTVDGLTVGTLAEYRLIAPWAPEPPGSTPELDAPVPDDVTVVAKNEPFPMLPLLVSVSAWTDWPTARAAFQGFRTAVVSTYRQPENDALCLSVKAHFEQFPQAFVDGLTAWGTAMGNPVSPVADRDDVQFSICDTATLGAPFPAEKAGATAAALLSIATAAAAKDEVERTTLLCVVDQVVRNGAADQFLRTREIAKAVDEVVRPNLLQLARQCRAAG